MYYRGVIGIGDFSGNTDITLKASISDTERNTQKLVVNGAVFAGNFRGAHGANAFPDYVFQKYYTGTSSVRTDYTFKTLSQVENFVKTNGYLPGYKSAADIKAQGYIDIMETQIANIEKIEELFILLSKRKH